MRRRDEGLIRLPDADILEKARREQRVVLTLQERIEEMVRRIVSQFNPEKVILFGSHARGEAGPDNDVDLLVVMAVEGSKRQKVIEIDRALADRRIPLDLIVVTPEDVERGRHEIGSVLRPGALEGRVLYDRAA